MDEEIRELMDDHDLDEDTAERVLDIMNEHGLSKDKQLS